MYLMDVPRLLTEKYEPNKRSVYAFLDAILVSADKLSAELSGTWKKIYVVGDFDVVKPKMNGLSRDMVIKKLDDMTFDMFGKNVERYKKKYDENPTIFDPEYNKELRDWIFSYGFEYFESLASAINFDEEHGVKILEPLYESLLNLGEVVDRHVDKYEIIKVMTPLMYQNIMQ